MTPHAIARGDRGTAAVEFALVLPLVLTITLALLQVGLLVRDRLVVESAARAGARGH
jgi:Flp pilus assembly protein TadG